MVCRSTQKSSFQRTAKKRHKTASIGKVADLFNGEGFDFSYPTKGNTEGIERLIERLKAKEEDLLFINLIDTDQLFGHRLDPVGYSEALMEIDSALPVIMDELTSEDVLIITGDQGMILVFKIPIIQGSLYRYWYIGNMHPLKI